MVIVANFALSTARKTLGVFFTKCNKYIPKKVKVAIKDLLKKHPGTWYLGKGTLYAIIYYLCLYYISDDNSKRMIHQYVCIVTGRQFDYIGELNLHTVFCYVGITHCGLSNEEIDEIRTATLEQQQFFRNLDKEVTEP